MRPFARKHIAVLKLLLLLSSVGCVPHAKKRSQQTVENKAPASAEPREPQEAKDPGESEAVMPPTPITGSYLVCRFSDPNKVAAIASEGLSLANLVKAPAREGAEGYCQPGRPPKAAAGQ